MGSLKSATLPLFEDGEAPRVLVTGFDRVETIDAGLYRYVATVNGIFRDVPARKVVCYIDITYAGVSAGIGLSFRHVRRLASGLLVPSLGSEDRAH